MGECEKSCRPCLRGLQMVIFSKISRTLGFGDTRIWPRRSKKVASACRLCVGFLRETHHAHIKSLRFWIHFGHFCSVYEGYICKFSAYYL